MFVWEESHTKEFKEIKELVLGERILKFHNLDLPIKVSADASKVALGSVLQQHFGGEWKPIAFASRLTTEAESRYALIERETLTVDFACTRFHQYIFGHTVEVETDHRPLVSIFKKSLNDCPPRIQRVRLKLQKYDIKLTHLPGKMMKTDDMLSRGPVGREKDRGQGNSMNYDVHLVTLLLSYHPVDWCEESKEEDIEAHMDGLHRQCQ